MTKRARSEGESAGTAKALKTEAPLKASGTTAPSAAEEHPTGPTNISDKTRVILCGSFPPPENRRGMPFYYPNVQNDMWRIMGSVFYEDPSHFIHDVPNPKGSGTRKAFDMPKVHRFVEEHPEFGFCDVARRIRRKTNDASDEGLEIVDEYNFPRDILPRAPACTAIIATGTLALTTLLAQRDQAVVPIRPSASPKGTASRRRKAALPAVGGSTPLRLRQVGNDGTVSERVVNVYRAPSTSRAYPIPFTQKETAYRSIIDDARRQVG